MNHIPRILDARLARRTALKALGAGALVPALDRLTADVVAHAQDTEPRTYRIGVVAPLTSGDVELVGHEDDPQDSGNHQEFRRRLADLGFIDGDNLVVEYRYARQPARWTAFAAELAELPVDVILAQGPATAQTIQGAGTTPVVFAIAADPVPAFVSNVSRPGGTVTGTTSLSTQGSASRLPLLIEAFPGLRRVASLYYGFGPAAAQRQFSVVSARALDLGVNVDFLAPQTADELADALAAIDNAHADGLLYFRGGPSPPDSDPTIDGVIAWAKAHRLPAAYVFRYFVERGGLMAIDTDPFENWRQAADRVAQILHGAYPGDLPVSEPTELRLFINLKTAQEQGLEFPQSIVDQTTEVLGQ